MYRTRAERESASAAFRPLRWAPLLGFVAVVGGCASLAIAFKWAYVGEVHLVPYPEPIERPGSHGNDLGDGVRLVVPPSRAVASVTWRAGVTTGRGELPTWYARASAEGCSIVLEQPLPFPKPPPDELSLLASLLLDLPQSTLPPERFVLLDHGSTSCDARLIAEHAALSRDLDTWLAGPREAPFEGRAGSWLRGAPGALGVAALVLALLALMRVYQLRVTIDGAERVLTVWSWRGAIVARVSLADVLSAKVGTRTVGPFTIARVELSLRGRASVPVWPFYLPGLERAMMDRERLAAILEPFLSRSCVG
jgi:hypothetical protein